MVADVVSGLGLPDALLRNEVSVDDDISEHRAGVALRRRPSSAEEEQGDTTGKHPDTITSHNFLRLINNNGHKASKNNSNNCTADFDAALCWMRTEGRRCRCGADLRNLSVVNVDNPQTGAQIFFFSLPELRKGMTRSGESGVGTCLPIRSGTSLRK